MSDSLTRHSVLVCAADPSDITIAMEYAQRIGVTSYDLLTIPAAASISPDTAEFIARQANVYLSLHKVEHGLRILMSSNAAPDVRTLFTETTAKLRKAFATQQAQPTITVEVPKNQLETKSPKAVAIYCGDWAHRKGVHSALLHLGHNPFDLSHIATPGGVALNMMQLAQMAALRNTDHAIIVLSPNCGAFGGNPKITRQQKANAEYAQGALMHMGFTTVEVVFAQE